MQVGGLVETGRGGPGWSHKSPCDSDPLPLHERRKRSLPRGARRGGRHVERHGLARGGQRRVAAGPTGRWSGYLALDARVRALPPTVDAYGAGHDEFEGDGLAHPGDKPALGQRRNPQAAQE